MESIEYKVNLLTERRCQQETFAEEIILRLKYHYRLYEKKTYPKDFSIVNLDIRDAIIAICYMFRCHFRQVFYVLHDDLVDCKDYENYCFSLPVARSKKYAFNFLFRVSFIFEITMYLFKEGYDYFDIARKCLAEYPDLRYFDAAGGWIRINEISCFILCFTKTREVQIRFEHPLLGTFIDNNPNIPPVSADKIFYHESIKKMMKLGVNSEEGFFHHKDLQSLKPLYSHFTCIRTPRNKFYKMDLVKMAETFPLSERVPFKIDEDENETHYYFIYDAEEEKKEIVYYFRSYMKDKELKRDFPLSPSVDSPEDGYNVDGIRDFFYMSEIREYFNHEESKVEKGKCHKSSKNSVLQPQTTEHDDYDENVGDQSLWGPKDSLPYLFHVECQNQNKNIERKSLWGPEGETLPSLYKLELYNSEMEDGNNIIYDIESPSPSGVEIENNEDCPELVGKKSWPEYFASDLSNLESDDESSKSDSSKYSSVAEADLKELCNSLYKTVAGTFHEKMRRNVEFINSYNAKLANENAMNGCVQLEAKKVSEIPHSTSNCANASNGNRKSSPFPWFPAQTSFQITNDLPHLAPACTNSVIVQNKNFPMNKKGLFTPLVKKKKSDIESLDRELKLVLIKIITDISYNDRGRKEEILKALPTSDAYEEFEDFFISNIVVSTPHCPCNDSSILAGSLKHVSYVSKETKFLLFKIIKYCSGITDVEKEELFRLLINIPDNPVAQKASIIDKIRNMLCQQSLKIQLVQCVLDLTLEECDELQCSLGGVDIDKSLLLQVLPNEDDLRDEYEKYYELYNIQVDVDMNKVNMFADRILKHLDISGIEEGIENEADWSPVKTILSNVINEMRFVVEEHAGEDLLSSASVASASSTPVAFQAKSCQKSEAPKRSAAQNLQRYRSHKKSKRRSKK